MNPASPTSAPQAPFVRVIPCLDVDGGRVVKGVNFVGLQDAGDPVEIARRYDQQGADELTLLDISATTQGRDTMLGLVGAVAGQINIPLIIGGGIRSVADMQRLLDAGAAKVSINSAAVREPELVREAAKTFGSQRIIIAIDAHLTSPPGEPPRWEVVTHGGSKATGLDVVAWAQKMAEYGAGELLLTSMDRDGTKAGFDLELLKAVSQAVSIPVIASGGVGELQHLADGVIKGGAGAVLAASVFHFGQFTIPQAKAFLNDCGINTRPSPAQS